MGVSHFSLVFLLSGCTSLFICSSICNVRLHSEVPHSYLCVAKLPWLVLAGEFLTLLFIIWQSYHQNIWTRIFHQIFEEFSINTPSPPTSITGGCFWFKKINTVFPLCDCPDGTGIHLKVTMSDMQGCMAAVTYGFCSWLPSICICKSEHGRSLDIHPADPPTTSIGLHPPPLFIFSIHSLSPE